MKALQCSTGRTAGRHVTLRLHFTDTILEVESYQPRLPTNPLPGETSRCVT